MKQLNRKEKITLLVDTIKAAGEPLSGHILLAAFIAAGSSFSAFHQGLTHAMRLGLIGDTDLYFTGIPFRAYYVVNQSYPTIHVT